MHSVQMAKCGGENPKVVYPRLLLHPPHRHLLPPRKDTGRAAVILGQRGGVKRSRCASRTPLCPIPGISALTRGSNGVRKTSLVTPSRSTVPPLVLLLVRARLRLLSVAPPTPPTALVNVSNVCGAVT